MHINTNHMYGFTPGPHVELPGLGVRVPLKRGVLFRYDGEVPSLSKNLARTELVLRGVIQEERDLVGKLIGPIWNRMMISIGDDKLHDNVPDLKTTRAYCFPHKIGKADAYVIAKEKGLSPALSVFADGHESGHLLEKMEQCSVLQELIAASHISLNLTDFRGEDFADVAGFLALYRSTIRDIPCFYHRQEKRKQIASAYSW